MSMTRRGRHTQRGRTQRAIIVSTIFHQCSRAARQFIPITIHDLILLFTQTVMEHIVATNPSQIYMQ